MRGLAYVIRVEETETRRPPQHRSADCRNMQKPTSKAENGNTVGKSQLSVEIKGTHH